MSRAFPSARPEAPAGDDAGLPRAARAVSSPGGRARLPFSAPHFYVDVFTTKQHRVAGGPFGTLLEAMEFFRAALSKAPDVNLRVRESGNYNWTHGHSYNGNVFTHAPRRISFHGPGT